MEQTTFKKTVSRVALCYFVLLALTLVLQSVLGGMAAVFFPQVMETTWYLWVLSYVPLYLIAVPVFVLMLRALVPGKQMPPHETLPLLSQLRYLVLSFGALYIFNIVSTLLTLGIAALKGTMPQNPLAAIQQGSSIWLNLIFGAIVAPVGEEFLFRKLLYDKIGSYGDRAYVLLGGLIFGLFHGNLSQLLYACVLGAIFCYVYAKTGNLLYTISLHVVVNLYGFVLSPLLIQNQVGTMVAGLVVIAMIGGSLAIFVEYRHKMSFAPGEKLLPEHPVRTALLNPGMLIYMAVCLVMVFLTLFPELFMGAAV